MVLNAGSPYSDIYRVTRHYMHSNVLNEDIKFGGFFTSITYVSFHMKQNITLGTPGFFLTISLGHAQNYSTCLSNESNIIIGKTNSFSFSIVVLYEFWLCFYVNDVQITNPDTIWSAGLIQEYKAHMVTSMLGLLGIISGEKHKVSSHSGEGTCPTLTFTPDHTQSSHDHWMLHICQHYIISNIFNHIVITTSPPYI